MSRYSPDFPEETAEVFEIWEAVPCEGRQPQDEQHRRARAIARAALINIAGNGSMAVLKLAGGFLGGSLALLGDGIDSLGDTIFSFAGLFTARLLLQPPDASYPWGYGRAEAILSKVLSMLMIFGSLQLLLQASSRLGQDFGWLPDGQDAHELPAYFTFYISALSVPIKLLLFGHEYRLGKRIHCKMLMANARHMLSDSILSASVLLGLGLALWTRLPLLEHLLALGVGLWILWIGLRGFRESSRELMDCTGDTKLYQQVFEAVGSVPGLSRPHRVRIRKISNLCEIILDVLAPPHLRLDQAHLLTEQVESAIRQRIPHIFDIVVHLEPQDINASHEQDEGFGMCPEALETFRNSR